MQQAFAAYARHDWGAAERLCRYVLKARLDHVDALNLLGVITAQTGRAQEALDLMSRVVAKLPREAAAHFNLGAVYWVLRRPQDALGSYERALALNPAAADVYNNRGVALAGLQRHAEALASYERAIALRPDYADPYYNRGDTLCSLERLAEALTSYERAIALRPDHPEALVNYGQALRDLKRYDEARESYERAMSLRPDYAGARYCLAQNLLQRGDFARGWDEYEWRWKREGHADRRRAFGQPLWLGAQSLTGKTILLHSEQGLGDTLQFCRYVKQVARLGANVILEVSPALLSLLSGLEGAGQVLPRGAELPAFDYHCPLLSLPLAFGTTLDSIAADVPYLECDKRKAEDWKRELGERRSLRVGLVWSSGAADRNVSAGEQRRRDIPLSILESLNIPKVQFYSLQKGAGAVSQLRDLESRRWNGPVILDYTDAFADFSDTAAFVANLDLVISVCTSVAHLAGAMGKTTWVLLQYSADWRWLLDRTDSPWYPSVTLVRQSAIGDWTNVAFEVRERLLELADNPPERRL